MAPGQQIPCPELGQSEEGAGTKAHVAPSPHPHLGTFSSPRCQHPGDVPAYHAIPCGGMEQGLGAHGSGSTPGQGCQCGWCLFGLWRDWAEAQGDMSPMAGDGRAGSAEPQSHYARQHCTGGVAELCSTPASTCPCAPEPSSCNKGPLSPPQPPHSGLSTCRLGWRWCRGGSEGPFCAG